MTSYTTASTSRVFDRRLPKLNSSSTFQRSGTRLTADTPDDVTSSSVDAVAIAAAEMSYPRPIAPLAGASVSNTYKTHPDVKFKTGKVKRLALGLLESKLAMVTYEPHYCKALGQQLAQEIMDKVKSLNMKRYKVVAVVSIGSNKEKPGIQFGSRCLWDKSTDSFVSVKFSNQSLFAVAMVYGLYYE